MSKLLFVLMIPVLLISCTHKADKNVMLFKALNDQLLYSNQEIDRSTDIELRSLEAKVEGAVTHDKAAIWYPNAMQIKLYSDSILDYIDTLKMALIQNSYFNTTDSIYREDNEDAPALVFETNGKAKELQEKLDQYKTAILSVDSGMTKEFGNISYDFERDPVSKEEQYFNHTYTIAAIAILSRLENKIKIIEKNMITYCNNRVGSLDGDMSFDKTAALVCQSSTEVTAGQKIEIDAGVGSFSSNAVPKITINGKVIPTTDGYVSYKITAASDTGKYTVPVRIEFKDQNGRTEIWDHHIEYRVVK